jgi:hypothetical protein
MPAGQPDNAFTALPQIPKSVGGGLPLFLGHNTVVTSFIVRMRGRG